MIIQNFDTLFLRWDDAHKEAFFPRERMSNRKIKYMFVLSGLIHGERLVSPSNEICTELTLDYFAQKYNDIVNLYDNDDRQILSNYSLAQLRFMQEENQDGIIANPLFLLSSEINPSLSFVRIADDRQVESGHSSEVVPVCVVWDDCDDTPQRCMLRAKSFDINSDEQKINISDITSYSLIDKEVKKIEVRGRNGYNGRDSSYSIVDKFLTIKTKDGNSINQLPSVILAKWGKYYDPYHSTDLLSSFRWVDDIFFDNLKIDEDLSFIENPSGRTFEGTITFYY